MIREYPKILALEKVSHFFEAHGENIIIEEKIDGSNVGVSISDDNTLIFQSRTQIIDQDRPEMFKPFVEWAQDIFVKGGFRTLAPTDLLYGEMVGNGKLRYNAPPFLLFDIRRDLEYNDKPIYLQPPYKDIWLPFVPRAPRLYEGPYQGIEHAKSFLGKSAFNDELMEGVVVKGYKVVGWYTRADGEETKYTEPLLCGKIVRETYKETRAPKKERIETVPLEGIAEALVTEARLQKARQRAQEEGKDVSRPHILIPYVIKDVFSENEDEIKNFLFAAYRKELSSAIARLVGTS